MLPLDKPAVIQSESVEVVQKVITVSSKGLVKAKKKGTAVITAKYGKKKLTCKVTVKQPVKSVKLNKKTANVTVGKKITLKATVSPTTVNNKTVTWKSSNTSVAMVSSKGVVIGKKKGTVTITATAKDGSGKKAVCKISVKNVVSQENQNSKITSISLDISELNIDEGMKYNFSVQTTPASDSEKLQWDSSNPSVATISSTGELSALKNGSTTISVSMTDGSNLKAQCVISVNNIPDVRKLIVNPNLQVVFTFMNYEYIESIVKWSSSDTRVATVTSTGKVKAVQKGTVVITATAKDGSGKKASCEVTVTDEITDNIVGEAYAILPTTSKEGAAVGIRFRNNTGINICVDLYAVCANMEEDFIREGYTVIDDTGVMFAEGYRKFSYDAYDEYEKNPTVTVEPGASREMFFEEPWGNYVRWDFTSSSYVLFDIIAGNECYLYKLDLTGTWKTYIEYTGYHCDVRERSTRRFDYVEDYNSNKVPDSSPSSPSDSSIKKVKIKEKCIFCHGSGKCGSCNGTGRLAAVTNRPNTCHACNSGRCGYCGGKGYTYDYDYIS